ncbi:hypothetical protein G3I60_21200 [Streptomyces sp. SID13666]|uniref:hypothetical protein n=1 Tax=unclassified Streptomyces TaxID=2593676 RepID=UPI0013C1E970|nr:MULTISPECIES: hypothetical protein [unclassified Streptomyces]NEA56583.1 hypothetical protein [Streptomyces sp. SID13666]NEA77037.1 hypothetical protein [Streptomyces sp. SID13588]
MPAPYITINIEPSGSVSAKGATDDLSATLLKHAGFRQIEDWYGRRHRLPTTTPQADRSAIASHAADMLRAARYAVDLDPDLDTGQLTTPTDPRGLQVAGGQVLRLTDQIKGAANAAVAAHAVDQLLDPTHGVLIRLQEALEATAETVTDLDDNAFDLADRFTAASEHLTAAVEELDGAPAQLHGLGDSSQRRDDIYQAQTATYYATAVTSAARATSPAATQASAALRAPASDTAPPSTATPSQGPRPRAR